MMFIPALVPPADRSTAAGWFLFHGTQLLVRSGAAGGALCVPQLTDPVEFGLTPDATQYLGTLAGVPCFLGAFAHLPVSLPPEYRFVNLRELFSVLPDPVYAVATRAAHLAQWDLTHRFCSRCAHPVTLKTDERAKHCAACGLVIFPQIAPAVIVAVRRNREILLARSPRFPPGMYSVLAGFVEAGESLEACAHREIREEAGIEVCNLRYFASQPWPYPQSLMLGFTAEYAGGELAVDGVEVTEAGWFSGDRLPQLPGKLSIARALIDDFVQASRA